MAEALGRTSRWRRFLSPACVVVALAYVSWMLWGHLDDLRASIKGIVPSGIVAFVLLATISIAITTAYHATLLGKLVPSQLPRLRASSAYAVGQIVRYLPGKVWGLLYEANVLRGRADLGSITLSVLVQTMLGYGWAMMLAVTVLLGAYTRTAEPFLLLLPAAWALWLAHRKPWPWRLIANVPLLGKRLGRRPPGLGAMESLRLSGLLVFNWLPFLAGWIFLLAGSHSSSEALAFGAAYIVASIATTVLIVVPSGLVVREALFTWIGTAIGFPVSDLLLYGVVVRVILTVADLLNAGMFCAADKYRRRAARDNE